MNSQQTMKLKQQNTALDICLRLARAQAVLIRRMDNALGSVHGLSFSDFQILLYLQRSPEGQLRRVDLAERLVLTASGVTRQLLPLEKTGLVSRQTNPRDARVGYAQITASGTKLLTHANKTAELVCAELLSNHNLANTSEFAAILGTIAGINLSNN